MKVGDLVKIGKHFSLSPGVITAFDGEFARVLWENTFEWVLKEDLEIINGHR